jgi:hypothetical protein
MRSPDNRKRTIAAVVARSWLSVMGCARAFHYCHAAKRDERNCFPCTAAMEWRKAAELFEPSTFAANCCWRQWERIMQLPRRLAGPIADPLFATLATEPASATRLAADSVIDGISLATAA